MEGVFTTDTGIRASYKVVGEDFRTDVKIKILSPIPKRYYYSALNEAGSYYDSEILPKLNNQNGKDTG